MKPAAFDYVRALSTKEALDVLAVRPGAKVLAGGQSLVPLMNFRLSRPEVLVDINHLQELDYIELNGAVLSVGPLVRHERLGRDPLVAQNIPVMAEAARHIGHWAVRNRGTIGGSAAHADPSAELPALLVALQARIVVQSGTDEVRIAAGEFFQGYYTTLLEPDQLITGFEIPVPAGRVGFSEVVRRPGDFALVGAYVERAEESGAVTWFGFGAKPERHAVAHWPSDSKERQALLREIVGRASVEPDEAYKRDMAVSVAERAYHQSEKEG